MNSAPVIVRIYGGLGNQLFMYACGLALACRRQAPVLVHADYDDRDIIPERWLRVANESADIDHVSVL